MLARSQMRQFEVTDFGESEVIKEACVDIPEVQGDLVRIRVKYAGINFADIMQRRGLFPGMGEPPFVPGMEVVGQVDATGPDVSSVSVGQRVFGKLEWGGYADYAVASQNSVFAVPDEIDDEDVLGLVGTHGQTAYGLADSLREPDGRAVFISAAAGGVGSILLQLCKNQGWKVIAGIGSSEKTAFVEKLGADYVVRYDQEGWEGKLSELMDANDLGVVFDAIGGSVHRGGLAALGNHGELVFYGGTSGDLVGLPPQMVFPFVIGCKAVRGFGLIGYYSNGQDILARTINGLFDSRLSGVIAHVATTIYPVDLVSEAHRSLESRASKGKLILDMTP